MTAVRSSRAGRAIARRAIARRAIARRSFSCLVLLATPLLALVAAEAINPPGAPPDHFLAYKTQTTKGTTKLAAVRGVRLIDDFEDASFDAKAVADFLVPVGANGDALVDAATHLRAYKIKAVKGSPKHVKRVRTAVTNHFGTQLVDTVKPDLLLVPTAQDPAVSPPAPDPATHAVDNYKCYAVRRAKGAAKLPKGLTVTVVDPFTQAAKVLNVKTLKHLCLPVDVQREGIENRLGDLACYTVAPAKKQPKHVPRRGVRVNNRFGPLVLDTAKETELCVPAVVPVPTPTPSSNGGPTVTPAATSSSATPTPVSTAGLPPDPETVAPDVDPAVASVPGLAASFLYDGDDPIQTGVAASAIDDRRAAVLRGRALDKSDTPLAGVRVTIVGHPELGETLTRADGVFDLVVNGGALLTVDYAKAGFLPVQRPADVPWQEFVTLPDVVLTALDPQVTAIDLSQGQMLMARGSVVSDADGTRRTTLLFPAGTSAAMIDANGQPQELTQLSVRATEYTVGANGPAAMPGGLPPNSAYTYAVELSVDEAMAAGARHVVFDQPIFHYVENFLDFPVGTPVPTGFYDRARGVWDAAANGVVIAVVSITAGLADLDTDGDGLADDGGTLGVTDEERQQLASLYSAGQTLWRVPIPHFSTVDCNWPFVPPSDAEAPTATAASDEPVDQCLDEEQVASVVECQNQILGETVPVVGTPFTLNYRSDRVDGHQGARTVRIAASDASIPASVEGIEVEMQIAGQTLRQTLPPGTNQDVSFTWDGLDVYGRALQGRQPFRASVGYVYDAEYATPAAAAQAFGVFGAAPISGDRVREKITIGQVLSGALGTMDARGWGLGGWTLSVHHAYDPEGQVLYLGTGQRMSAGAIRTGVETVVGGGAVNATTGLQATAARLLQSPFSMVFTADGTLFFSIPAEHRIGRVGLDGVLALFGSGPGFGGDGQLLGFASFSNPQGIAIGADGVGYVADTGNHRVRRVEPIGTIGTFAGNGGDGFSGDDGAALDAELSNPSFVAVGPDGSVYIADDGNHRVRRVGAEGTITTIAGGGTTGGNQIAGIPARAAQLGTIGGLAVDKHGRVYVANDDSIVRIGLDGTATVIAGDASTCGFAGDGGPASLALLCQPTGLTLDADGNLYIGDAGNDVIRVVRADGSIDTAAGGGDDDDTDEVPATQARLQNAHGPAVAPDGSLHVVAEGPNRIRRLQSLLPAFDTSSFSVASEDGRLLYQFDPFGRHLRTVDTLTAGTLYLFAYDANGRLVEIRDGEDNATTIQRNAGGSPTAIVGPLGHTTTLGLDANGFLASLTNPASETVAMTSTAGGLVTAFTDARGNTSEYAYDELGRLSRAEDPAGGFHVIDRTAITDGHEITRTTALGRISTYRVARQASGAQQLTNIAPDGTVAQYDLAADGTQLAQLADGSEETRVTTVDPRFGMSAAIVASEQVVFPGAPTFERTYEETAVLGEPDDPLSIQTLTQTSTTAGHALTTVYDAGTRTFTNTTALGRTESVTVDGLGRTVASVVPGVGTVTTTRDGRGRLATVTVDDGTPGTRTFAYDYDADGLLASALDPRGREVQFGYDAAGRLIAKTRADGEVIAFARDANGNMTGVTPPGRPAHVLTYSARNELTAVTPPTVAGTGPTLFAYDLDRRPTTITRPDERSVALAYDTGGRLATRTLLTSGTPTGADTFTYDAAGRLATTATAGGVATSHAYHGSLRAGVTWSGPIPGSVTRTFDTRLLTASESVNGANPVAFAYDADGLLTGAGTLVIARDAANGLPTGTTLGTLSDTIAFSGFGELASYALSASGTPLYAFTLTRDAGGRVTRTAETVNGVTATYDYAYDVLGQLVGVEKNDAAVEAYGYDLNGNRTSANVGGGDVTATYDAQDRLLQYGGAAFTSNPGGELESRSVGLQTTDYEYDPLGNLVGVTLPDSTSITYLADAAGRRVGKRVDGTLVQGWLYDARSRVVAELDGAGAIVSRFVYGAGGTAAYMVRGGVAFRLVTDAVGSVRLVVNSVSGAIVQRIDYDAFGRVASDTNPGFQPFGFAGGLYDPATGLVRFGARDYDAATGRWTAKDPTGFTGGDANLYRYVGNDPVNLVDPTGLVGVDEELAATARLLDEITDVDIQLPGGEARAADEVAEVTTKQVVREERLLKKIERLLGIKQTAKYAGQRGGGASCGGLVGKANFLLGLVDFFTVAQRAAETGRSYFEELDVQAEHETEEQRARGVHTTISCLGPFCLVNDIGLI